MLLYKVVMLMSGAKGILLQKIGKKKSFCSTVSLNKLSIVHAQLLRESSKNMALRLSTLPIT